MNPLILINFKTYPEALGEKGAALAGKIAQVRTKISTKKYQIAIAPTLPMIKEVVDIVNKINKIRKVKTANPLIFAQHCDPITDGAHTGSISLKELKDIGVPGTLLNHSERKIPLPILKETIRLCRQYHFTTVACASSLSEVRIIAQFHLDYIAYEPPELIGGNISVTKAEPEVILKAVRLVKTISPGTKVLCGAGIQGKEDIIAALQLGATGVLIGHAAAQARDPKRFLEELLT